MYEPYTAGLIVNACAMLHNMRIKYKLNEPEATIPMQIMGNDGRVHDDAPEVKGT